ncbi:MAG: hypothetical protein ILP19_01550 [Oscillospiraceae bacterium]|nr:hypothetical protein [Oscillospiraceae bacterium]
MKKMENYLKEVFAFQKFDPSSPLHELTDKTLAKYGLDDSDELMLSFDDLANVAAGVDIDIHDDDMKGEDQ